MKSKEATAKITCPNLRAKQRFSLSEQIDESIHAQNRFHAPLEQRFRVFFGKINSRTDRFHPRTDFTQRFGTEADRFGVFCVLVSVLGVCVLGDCVLVSILLGKSRQI